MDALTESRRDSTGLGRPRAGGGGSFEYQFGKRMVCLDIDGTLVNHDGYMSEAVRTAARAVVADGHTVVVSTGRSLRAMLPIVEKLGIEQGYAICSNGGVTVKIDVSLDNAYEVIERQVFDPAPALDALNSRLLTARYAIETSSGTFLATERFEDMSFGLSAQGVSFHEMRMAEAVRLVVNSTASTVEDFGTTLADLDLHGVAYSVGGSAWLDIAAHGVTKGSSLESLRRRLEVPRHYTVAVGDGRNDLEMIMWANWGVAMGQAANELKQVANEVTGNVDSDGLLEVLYDMLDSG